MSICVHEFAHICITYIIGDVYWLSRLAELGHSIVGIEASTIPIEEFFNERNLQYTVEVCEQIPGQLYKVGVYLYHRN